MNPIITALRFCKGNKKYSFISAILPNYYKIDELVNEVIYKIKSLDLADDIDNDDIEYGLIEKGGFVEFIKTLKFQEYDKGDEKILSLPIDLRPPPSLGVPEGTEVNEGIGLIIYFGFLAITPPPGPTKSLGGSSSLGEYDLLSRTPIYHTFPISSSFELTKDVSVVISDRFDLSLLNRCKYYTDNFGLII